MLIIEPGCRTDGGAKPNKRCIFPFIFDGKNFTTCATHGVKNWCAVKVDSDGTYISGEWGNCEPTCPTGNYSSILWFVLKIIFEKNLERVNTPI